MPPRRGWPGWPGCAAGPPQAHGSTGQSHPGIYRRQDRGHGYRPDDRARAGPLPPPRLESPVRLRQGRRGQGGWVGGTPPIGNAHRSTPPALNSRHLGSKQPGHVVRPVTCTGSLGDSGATHRCTSRLSSARSASEPFLFAPTSPPTPGGLDAPQAEWPESAVLARASW
jgi:hypothetical protein